MPINIISRQKGFNMIKNYSNKNTVSQGVAFIFRAAKKRRTIALNNAKEVQLELGLAPTLMAVK